MKRVLQLSVLLSTLALLSACESDRSVQLAQRGNDRVTQRVGRRPLAGATHRHREVLEDLLLVAALGAVFEVLPDRPAIGFTQLTTNQLFKVGASVLASASAHCVAPSSANFECAGDPLPLPFGVPIPCSLA